MRADAIYFLMSAGWTTELRSNRWHYASRWARHLPVVLVQPEPDLGLEDARTERDAGIPNARVLYVRGAYAIEHYLTNALIQCEQIRRDIVAHGYERVIFWMYNSEFAFSAAVLPAVCRVWHASENYFDYPNLPSFLIDRLRAATRAADLMLCVSEGVARSFRDKVRGAAVEVLSNGCDFAFYSRGGHDAELAAEKARFDNVAVFAGNVDDRLDWDMLDRALEACPDVLFVMYGPLTGGPANPDAKLRRTFRRTNFRYFGVVPAERLPGIYATCDVGIIPYRHDPLVTHNTFPLKAFEMVAAGLPVVATNLDMLRPYHSPGFAAVTDAATFIERLRAFLRASLSPLERENLRSLAEKQDYGHKFETAREWVQTIAEQHPDPNAPLGELLGIGSASGLEAALSALEPQFAHPVLPVGTEARLSWKQVRRDLRGMLRVLKFYVARTPVGPLYRVARGWMSRR